MKRSPHTARKLAALLSCALFAGTAAAPAAAAAAAPAAAPAAAAAAISATDPTRALADQAVANNPSLAAQEAVAAQLRARAQVAGAWSDPMVAVEYSNVPVDSWGLADHPMAGLQFKVQQQLRPPAWSRQQREVGTQHALAAEAMVQEQAVALRAAVATAWWSLARTRQLRAVTVDHISRTEELLAAVRSRYEVGSTGQSSVLRLTVLRDQLQDDLDDYDRTDAELVAALDTALARQDGPGTYATPSRSTALPAPAPADWRAIATDHRPALARLAAQRDAARAAQDLARTDALPDPSIWAGYRLRTVQTATDPGTDLVAIGLSVPIPTGSGRRARAEEAGWLDAERAADASTRSLLDRIDGDMRATLARWDRATGKADVYGNSLVPTAQTTLDATLNDFSVGQTDFAALFEAEVSLLNLERTRIIATTDTWQSWAHALSLLGTDALALPAQEASP